MARYSRQVRIGRPMSEVWAHLMDVEGWPAWAPQFKRLERIDARPLDLGSRVRVTPRGLPPAIWTVTEFEPGRLFTWASSLAPGVRLRGGHELRQTGDGTGAEFWLEAGGPIGRLLAPVLRRTVFERNTRQATEGLKRHAES